MTLMRKLIRTLFISLFLAASVAPVFAAANPYGGVAVTPPAPTEKIFTVSNGSTVKEYSMNDLLKKNSVTLKIYEPFVKKQQTFRAIPLSTFLADAKISSKSTIKTIALNDYVYANTAGNFLKANAYIAIQLASKPIAYDQGGPIRIIFPSDSTWAKNLDPWNWSLRSIVVK